MLYAELKRFSKVLEAVVIQQSGHSTAVSGLVVCSNVYLNDVNFYLGMGRKVNKYAELEVLR